MIIFFIVSDTFSGKYIMHNQDEILKKPLTIQKHIGRLFTERVLLKDLTNELYRIFEFLLVVYLITFISETRCVHMYRYNIMFVMHSLLSKKNNSDLLFYNFFLV